MDLIVEHFKTLEAFLEWMESEQPYMLSHVYSELQQTFGQKLVQSAVEQDVEASWVWAQRMNEIKGIQERLELEAETDGT